MASLFVLATISILGLLCCCHGDLIDDICADPGYFISPSRCTKILRSDPRARGADLRTLGQIAVAKTKVAIKHTAKVAMSVRNRDNFREVHACIQGCRFNIDSLTNLGKLMLKDPEGRTEGGLAMAILSIKFNMSTCEDDFMMLDGGEPAKLTEASGLAYGLMNVVSIIAEKL